MPGKTEPFVVLGKIVDAYGVKGWVRIHPFADDPLAWQKMPTWWLRPDDGRADDQGWRPVGCQQCRMQGTALLVALEGVADRTLAESLRGSLVGAPRSMLPKTAQDEYYWADLAGLKVANRQGEDLGEVAELMETGANDVMVVRDGQGGERLIPFVAAVVVEVDLEGRRVVVDWGMDW